MSMVEKLHVHKPQQEKEEAEAERICQKNFANKIAAIENCKSFIDYIHTLILNGIFF